MVKMSSLFIIAFALLLVGCGGSQNLSSPRLYADAEKQPEEKSEQTADEKKTEEDTAKENEAQKTENKAFLNSVLKQDEPQSETKVSDKAEQLDAHKNTQSEDSENDLVYYNSIDIDDSASAVDDDLWRQFDLAEEYHAMGVLANREAAWEEAQYYFEKSFKILANLDVESSDTLITPEATKYNEILDNLIAEYRITLRSLGTLTEDVSSAVLVEQFGDLGVRLGTDTMKVYNEEAEKVTYDIPIVMNDRVKSSIVYFQTVAKEAFKKYLRRSKKYTPMMKEILKEYDLPEDLIYLSLVESGYNPHAYSWARAMGLWQFIASTGRLYKLDRSWWYDERKDPVKSTHAACQFLKDLYEQFGSWELAMAAYNGGPGRVRRTIKSQKTIDFWKMKLKRQTMDYVPLIMAAAIIAKNPEKYGFYDIEFEPEIVWDEVKIDKCLELKVVAEEIGCTLEELQLLNPELLRRYTPPNTEGYILKVPKGKSDKFWAAYDGMPSPKETSWVQHQISRGETVSTIAAKYGVSQYAIFEANNLSRRSLIIAGKKLIVPVPLDKNYTNDISKPTERTASNSVYAVQSGDTMWDIAKSFGTTVSELRQANSIVRGSRIYVGQKLRIPSSAKNLKQKSSSTYAATPNSSNTVESKSSSSSTAKTYKVKSGDTLWDIARKFGTTTASIRNLNSLGRSSRIYPGQVLNVNTNVNYVWHKVSRGETLSSIAQRYRTSIARIRANNNIDDPHTLQIGTNLKIY